MNVGIERTNVGRIAERIVANELEYHGYRVSDLNKDGLSANADLIASNGKLIRQIQVKGATNKRQQRWWIQYGYCTEGIIHGGERMFNRRESFYVADIVVLVAVKSPQEYRCIVLPKDKAEEAAQINIDRGYRTLKRTGEKKQPGKVWAWLDASPREHKKDKSFREQCERERAILSAHANWAILG